MRGEEKYIPKSECKDRVLYRIHSRNLSLGVYRGVTGGFVGIRTKFGSRFLFEEYHYDNGPPYGTVFPVEELENLPDDIVNEESEGSLCRKCNKPAHYEYWPDGGRRDKVLEGGNVVKVPGYWKHEEESDCPIDGAFSVENKRLFDWLAEMDKKYIPPGGPTCKVCGLKCKDPNGCDALFHKYYF